MLLPLSEPSGLEILGKGNFWGRAQAGKEGYFLGKGAAGKGKGTFRMTMIGLRRKGQISAGII